MSTVGGWVPERTDSGCADGRRADLHGVNLVSLQFPAPVAVADHHGDGHQRVTTLCAQLLRVLRGDDGTRCRCAAAKRGGLAQQQQQQQQQQRRLDVRSESYSHSYSCIELDNLYLRTARKFTSST